MKSMTLSYVLNMDICYRYQEENSSVNLRGAGRLNSNLI